MPVRSKLPSVLSGLGVIVAAAFGSCGGDPDPPPGPKDIAQVGSSLGDIVFQCESVAAGFIAAPERALLTRDVDTLIAVFDRVNPDSGYTAGAEPGPTRRTSVRDELRLARRTLTACEPRLAKRLDAAVGR